LRPGLDIGEELKESLADYVTRKALSLV
jgi:hypothetical protein